MHGAPEARTRWIEAVALEAGADVAGCTRLEAFPEAGRIIEWLDGGSHGTMAYLARTAATRADPTRFDERARSALVVGVAYQTAFPFSMDADDGDPERGWIARYAWGRDYHNVMRRLSKRLKKAVAAVYPEALLRFYSDKGPLPERVLAARAGLGFIGKNTSLIHPEYGPYLVLGVLLTDLELTSATMVEDGCGRCTMCLDACPARALVAPRTMDARRCVSYLTIESTERIPSHLLAPVGANVFGCDVCHDVCPYARRARMATRPDFDPRPGLYRPNLEHLATMDRAAYEVMTAGSVIRRRGVEGLKYNARVALDNVRRR